METSLNYRQPTVPRAANGGRVRPTPTSTPVETAEIPKPRLRLRVGVAAQAVLLALGGLCTELEAQTPSDELGSWLMYFGANRVGARTSIHTEVQLRYWELLTNYNQLLLRVGYNFDLDQSNMVSVGYAFVDTSPFDATGTGSDEHRLWQQFLQRTRLEALAFEHRFRVEERWVASGGTTDFEMRFRYRILVNIPLGGAGSPFFLSTYDEVMISLDSDPFDQNRLYGALAYGLDERGSSLQVGYLLNSFSGEHRSRLQIAAFLNTDLR